MGKIRRAIISVTDKSGIVEAILKEMDLKEMEELDGEISLKTRFRLAKKVFNLTHQYDGAISRYLDSVDI